MSGPSDSQVGKQTSISNSQTDLSKDQLDLAKRQESLSEEDRKQSKALVKPAIDFNSKVASGDKTSLMQALGPQLAEITKGASRAKGQINEQVGPGAARDVAQAQVIAGKEDAIAGKKNDAYTSALDKLANIGSGIGSFSLSELGASLSGFSGSGNSLVGASQTNQAVLQAENQKKASTMGFLGELAGGAGHAAGGFLGKP